MKKKSVALLMVLALVLSMFAGCSSSTSTEQPTQTGSPATQEGSADGIKTGGTLLLSLGAEPTSLNPDGNYDANNGYIIQNVFNRLVKLNSKNEILPDLAKSHEVSADGLTYTFHLHENVLFHDGQKMTSKDVKFTFEQIMAQQGVASFSLGKLASIETPDDNTVVMKTSEVDAAFLYNLAYQGTFILPQHLYEGKNWVGTDAMQDPVGTGPFKYEGWEKGVRMTLVRNQNYFLDSKLPYLDKVVIGFIADPTTAKNSFVAGEYDVLGTFASTDFNEYRANPDITLEVNIYPSRFMVAFNNTKAPFDNINVRKAVAHAIDTDEMLNIALKEVGLKSEYFLSPLFEWAYNKEAKLPTFDLAQAQSLMEQSGLTKDANGNYLSITVDTMNYSPFPDVAQVFKSQLAKIGIDVKINPLEYASYDEKVVKNRNFEVGITSDYEGPEISAIANTIKSDGYMNVMGYKNAEVDENLAKALMVVPYEERAPFYQSIQAQLAKDVPYFIFSEWIGYYPHWSYVKGHPGNPDVADRSGTGEFTYTWIDK